MKRNDLSCVLLSRLSAAAFLQEERRRQRGNVSEFDGTHDTANSGLANNSVNAIVIDSLGNKWFGISEWQQSQ